jgi:hypothetical protein
LPPAKEEGITFGKKKGNKREEKVGKRYCLWQYFGFFLFYSPFGGNCFFFLPLFLPEANETEANEPEEENKRKSPLRGVKLQKLFYKLFL